MVLAMRMEGEETFSRGRTKRSIASTPVLLPLGDWSGTLADYRGVTLRLDAARFTEVAHGYGVDLKVSNFLHDHWLQPLPYAETLKNTIWGLFDFAGSLSGDSAAEVQAMETLIYSGLVRSVSVALGKEVMPPKGLAQRMRDVIEANGAGGTSVEVLAAAFGRTLPEVSEAFYRAYDVSIETYLARRNVIIGEPESPLTLREHETLRNLSFGKSYAMIAASMGVSINTVQTNIRSLYRKLGVTSAVAAVRSGRERGLL